jgi:hypothetical protein
MSPSGTPDMPGMSLEGSAHAIESRESHQLEMGPHTRMTVLCASKPGDMVHVYPFERKT